MWCVSSGKVMLPAGNFRKSSAGGAKMRSGAVWMLSAERFARRDGGRGGVKLDNCGGAGFMVGVVCKIVVVVASQQGSDDEKRI
jgi:hypothetical protein